MAHDRIISAIYYGPRSIASIFQTERRDLFQGNTQFIEFRGVTVATKDLRDTIKNGIRTEDCLFRVDGGLQVEEIQW